MEGSLTERSSCTLASLLFVLARAGAVLWNKEMKRKLQRLQRLLLKNQGTSANIAKHLLLIVKVGKLACYLANSLQTIETIQTTIRIVISISTSVLLLLLMSS